MRATHTISTIGYEGASIEEFVATLRSASIDLVIDVRAIPLSRKRGFSKSRLAERLSDNGIEYVHLKGLGDPREGREAARAGNYARFEKIFDKHLRSKAAIDALDSASSMVRTRKACLMCFEAEPAKCHRTIVADRLAGMTGLIVRALTARSAAKVLAAA